MLRPAILRRVRLADLTHQRATRPDRAGVHGDAGDPRARRGPIVEAVRDGGDAALREANARYGGGLAGTCRRPGAAAFRRSELREARDRLPRELRRALEHMAANIERFHRVEVPARRAVGRRVEPGIEVGRVWRGLDRVAAYVPGGTAPTHRRCS